MAAKTERGYIDYSSELLEYAASCDMLGRIYSKATCLEAVELTLDRLSWDEESKWNSNGYHNKYHCIAVAYRTIYLARKENVTDPRLMMNLILAALFHDAEYVIGDSERDNIMRSVTAMRETLWGYIDQHDVVMIEQLMWATEFIGLSQKKPFASSHTDVQLLMHIISDADLLQNVSPDRDVYMNGLRDEGLESPSIMFPFGYLSTHSGRELYGAYVIFFAHVSEFGV